eukprot:Hpha_TRINITY_DN15032_c8_g1::TRINITY_DN15032_c8_g1_i1::g.124310::m.124310
MAAAAPMWYPSPTAPTGHLSRNLTQEQEMLKMMLPATRPHPSFRSWVTPQMLCVRVATKHGHKRQREKRVVSITPTALFLVHPVGEVRRFVKMAQLEKAVASEVIVGGRRYAHLLLKCAFPEHDILLTFLPDSRNIDQRESPATVLLRLEQLKRLRGEYFPVHRTQGDLFASANLAKAPQYLAPKKRMDKAMATFWRTDDTGAPEYNDDGTDPVDCLGGSAGQMGGHRPMPLPSAFGSPPATPGTSGLRPRAGMGGGMGEG